MERAIVNDNRALRERSHRYFIYKSTYFQASSLHTGQRGCDSWRPVIKVVKAIRNRHDTDRIVVAEWVLVQLDIPQLRAVLDLVVKVVDIGRHVGETKERLPELELFLCFHAPLDRVLLPATVAKLHSGLGRIVTRRLLETIELTEDIVVVPVQSRRSNQEGIEKIWPSDECVCCKETRH